jgi:hypothetical protein
VNDFAGAHLATILWEQTICCSIPQHGPLREQHPALAIQILSALLNPFLQGLAVNAVELTLDRYLKVAVGCRDRESASRVVMNVCRVEVGSVESGIRLYVKGVSTSFAVNQADAAPPAHGGKHSTMGEEKENIITTLHSSDR